MNNLVHFVDFTSLLQMDGSGTRWGGTTNTTTIYSGRSRNSKIRKSIDVVAGLFQMSNELREERESIMTRTSKDGSNNNMEAFLNRETTLKYNDELEEVAQVGIKFFFQSKNKLMHVSIYKEQTRLNHDTKKSRAAQNPKECNAISHLQIF